MSPAPCDLSLGAIRADALFASTLQYSDRPSAGQVRQAIAAAIGAHGDLGCVARVAQAYGEDPDTAVTRMRWARTAVASAFDGSQAEPAHAVRRRRGSRLRDLSRAGAARGLPYPRRGTRVERGPVRDLVR